MTSGSIPVSELREQLAAVIDELGSHGKAVKLTRHGQPIAVLMGYEAFEKLLDDLDDADDYRALAEYDAAASDDTIPWELAKQDLGIA
ncbi:type II toxin-antitoxin system Phd/YefM family antitoxin [Mycobacterium sp.]|uniref:type II toxin-antitoxin system Phd/YefM family antitoxin n=1 Tax=Mycobacterium sp. TaxID=1785 RepID=UPI002C912A57|nr:type II toxin-antitoxin system Phd/YefM family antitoxin [Mycobacterium sp.]HTQ17244.1 type II toxin-antitoxin system Phd/YefM family antitoxin [Mycobacterium sp.]